MIEIFINLTLLLSVVALLGFAWIYDRGANPGQKRVHKWGKGLWRNSREGKAIMAQKLSISAFVLFILCLRTFGGFEGDAWLKLLGYTAINIVFWVMLINLINIFKEKK